MENNLVIEELYKVEGNQPWPTKLAFSPRGEILASSSSKGVLILQIQAAGGQITTTLEAEARGGISFSPDGQYLAGADFQIIQQWQTFDWRKCKPLGEGGVMHSMGITCLAYHPSGQFIASGSLDTSINIFRIEGAYVQTIEEWSERHQTAWDIAQAVSRGPMNINPNAKVSCISFSPDGQLLIAGYEDFSVRIYKLVEGKYRWVHSIKQHKRKVQSVVFSNDGKIFASASIDSTICLWQADTYQLIRVIKGHEDGVCDIAFHKDGESLASCSSDKSLRFWKISNGHEIQRVDTDNEIYSLAISPDGHYLASAGITPHVISLWSIS